MRTTIESKLRFAADGVTSNSMSVEILRPLLIDLLNKAASAKSTFSAIFGRSYPANAIQTSLKGIDWNWRPFIATHESTARWTASEMDDIALSIPILVLLAISFQLFQFKEASLQI